MPPLTTGKDWAMYCSECGQPAQGKFCSQCGAPLITRRAAADAILVEIVPDWDHEVSYETILKYPGVRETIERHAQQAPKRLSGEKFLQLAEKLMPTGVPLEELMAVVQPLYARLGIKTGKERIEELSVPVGKVIVRALCSLARHGQLLRSITQATDGCLFEATLPSDMFALEGSLLVSVRRSGSRTEVRSATCIEGQLYDWGKSKRSLNQLFADLAREAA
ncbi:MAG TPA: zinc ribbon domain-containing protein [Lacipirellulaceae bacterium]|nr:zinc ribbon domain-containing protein [Lacipirellulaceae bacterium]